MGKNDETEDASPPPPPPPPAVMTPEPLSFSVEKILSPSTPNKRNFAPPAFFDEQDFSPTKKSRPSPLVLPTSEAKEKSFPLYSSLDAAAAPPAIAAVAGCDRVPPTSASEHDDDGPSPTPSTSSNSSLADDDEDDDDDDDSPRQNKRRSKKREGESAAAAAAAPPIPASPGYLVSKSGRIRVELLHPELWRKFHKLSTEMIITKAGRRMFPTLKVRLVGLEPDATYVVSLELRPFDDRRYRYIYTSSQWMSSGAADRHDSPNLFIHGDSPTTGAAWCGNNNNGGGGGSNAVVFDKLKLTNNRGSLVAGQICLHSMHRYQPVIHVQKIEQEQLREEVCLESLVDLEKSEQFAFPETVFTTVTAYQNQQITKLKIASNPFAKGFREATRTRDPHVGDFASTYFKTFDSLLLQRHLLGHSAATGGLLPPPSPFLFPPTPPGGAGPNPMVLAQPFLPPSPLMAAAAAAALWPSAMSASVSSTFHTPPKASPTSQDNKLEENSTEEKKL